jgi:hypothetical protein
MTHYPNLLKLKTIGYELDLLMKSYETGQETYRQHMLIKNYTDASAKLEELATINKMIETKLVKGEEILTIIQNDGSIDDEVLSLQNKHLRTISQTVQTQQSHVNKLQEEINNIDGNLDTSGKNQRSNYLQYMVLVILGIIILGLTAKTIVTKDDSILDTVILVIVVGLLIYFIMEKVLDY